MALILKKPARARMARDGIKEAWIETIIRQPQHSMRDPLNPALTQAWRRVPQLGGRAVRVVFYGAGAEFVVLTAFLDRGAGRWLP
jgi:hypothetical protein